MLTLEQEQQAVQFYKDGLKIKEIMKLTQIRSEQTIYRILDDNRIPRRPKRLSPLKVTVYFNSEIVELINKENPSNISNWVCEKIKKATE